MGAVGQCWAKRPREDDSSPASKPFTKSMGVDIRQWRIPSNVDERLQTVVETPTYLTTAQAFLSEVEREEIVNRVAVNPNEGASLGAGIRKVRIGLSGRGKRGGDRVVYFFGGNHMPVFLLAAFAKNEKVDLTPQERQMLIRAGKRITAQYRSSR